MILVTGGAGFIGSNFVLDWLRETGVAYQLWQLFRVGRIIHLKREHFKPHFDVLTRLVRASVFSAREIGDFSSAKRMLPSTVSHSKRL